jgi:hypothetical protein
VSRDIGMPSALFPAFAEHLGGGPRTVGVLSAVLRDVILLTAAPDDLRGRLSGIELAQVAGAPPRGTFEGHDAREPEPEPA